MNPQLSDFWRTPVSAAPANRKFGEKLVTLKDLTVMPTKEGRINLSLSKIATADLEEQVDDRGHKVSVCHEENGAAVAATLRP